MLYKTTNYASKWKIFNSVDETKVLALGLSRALPLCSFEGIDLKAG